MVRQFELATQRRNTAAHLDADGEAVILSRAATPVPDGAGGYTMSGNGSTLPPQAVILSTTDRQLPVRRTVDGIEVTPEYVMTAAHTADIRPGDWFYREGAKFEVVFVHLDRSYEITAEVIYRG